MKKIKSVKLKRDLQHHFFDKIQIAPSGTSISKFNSGTWIVYFDNVNPVYYYESTILNNPDFFEIEYEQEREYIDVRIEFENDEYNDSWKPVMIRDIEKTLNNNFIMTKNFKITELAEGTL